MIFQFNALLCCRFCSVHSVGWNKKKKNFSSFFFLRRPNVVSIKALRCGAAVAPSISVRENGLVSLASATPERTFRSDPIMRKVSLAKCGPSPPPSRGPYRQLRQPVYVHAVLWSQPRSVCRAWKAWKAELVCLPRAQYEGLTAARCRASRPARSGNECACAGIHMQRGWPSWRWAGVRFSLIGIGVLNGRPQGSAPPRVFGRRPRLPSRGMGAACSQ